MQLPKSIKILILPICLIMFSASLLNVMQPDEAHAAKMASTSTNALEIDEYVESMMDKLSIPGVAVGVVKGNETVYLKGYGISGNDQQPVTPQTPFVLGSSSKSFTALAIMQLVEQGKIDLEAPVKRYLPKFELADKEASETILVKHLLSHNSGLSTSAGRIAFSNKFSTIAELITNSKDIPLTEPVGSTYQYSNLNYDLLGGIIEAVSGLSYADYIQNQVFNPLDMKNSYTSKTEAQKNGLAVGHQSFFGVMRPVNQTVNQSMLPSAYLISSAEDMANYLNAQINKGKFQDRSVATAESINIMHRPAVEDPSIGGFYGMGWEIVNNVVQHAGDVESFHSDMLLDGDTGIIVLINAHDYLVRGPQFGKIASGILEIMNDREPSNNNVGSITGTYLVIDLVCAAAVILLGVSIFRLFRWNNRKRFTTLRITTFALFLVIFNVLVPVVILYGLSHYVAPWSVVFSFLPGLGQLAFILSILSIGIGAAKAVRLGRSLKTGIHEKISSS
ncbi:beta-lactamase family protein [Paenibacillus albidus]|uniref:serine hydrolase domain-containing protein n=1 Tax=Paenibacillus albidus TaxID=2041023 RepID=UPI001BEBBCCD|nr:serine hydrolase domain-containing protein [Paenibacillus albidus]MBT2289759.1 beta-lactamase family protein [Paenibacillus albidus]